MGSSDKFRIVDRARVHAGSAHADFPSLAYYPAQHDFDVVETLGHFLATFDARSGIADQENLDFLTFGLR